MSKVINKVCHNCNGGGKEPVCPKCGATPRAVSTERIRNMSLPVNIVPLSYQGKIWEKPATDSSLKFSTFDNKLERIQNEFMSGRIPKFSVFLGAPMKYGKHTFAHSCIQSAISNQFTAAPLLSISDWRRLYKVSQMNPMYKLYDQYRWDTLVTVDVVFLYIDHSDERHSAFLLLKDLLDVRAGFNLPTFILSDYKLTELVSKWDSKDYQIIYNPDDNRDMLRYPVILQRFE